MKTYRFLLNNIGIHYMHLYLILIQILEPCSQTYQTVFFALWRAKRMESILSAIWKQQITSAKIFRKMPEILPIQNQIHLITSSMVHLVHQLQYYFLFEVNL